MSQIVFTLRPPSEAPRAQKYVTEGYQANQHCRGRGRNPYPAMSLRFDWWDQGWCEFELIDLPAHRRKVMERYLAGGNE